MQYAKWRWVIKEIKNSLPTSPINLRQTLTTSFLISWMNNPKETLQLKLIKQPCQLQSLASMHLLQKPIIGRMSCLLFFCDLSKKVSSVRLCILGTISSFRFFCSEKNSRSKCPKFELLVHMNLCFYCLLLDFIYDIYQLSLCLSALQNHDILVHCKQSDKTLS